MKPWPYFLTIFGLSILTFLDFSFANEESVGNYLALRLGAFGLLFLIYLIIVVQIAKKGLKVRSRSNMFLPLGVALTALIIFFFGGGPRLVKLLPGVLTINFFLVLIAFYIGNILLLPRAFGYAGWREKVPVIVLNLICIPLLFFLTSALYQKAGQLETDWTPDFEHPDAVRLLIFKFIVLAGPFTLMLVQLYSSLNPLSFNRKLSGAHDEMNTKQLLDRLRDGAAELRIESARLLGVKKNIEHLPILKEEIKRIHGLFFIKTSREAIYDQRLKGQIEESIQELEKFHGRNVELQPELWCTRCNARTHLEKYDGYAYVVCNSCGKFDSLKPGVGKAIGVIGTYKKEYKQGDVVEFGIWSENTKEIHPAEVEEIIIRGGLDWNYDWAVAALAKSAQEHPLLRGRKIRITLENGVNLQENSMALLHQIQQGNV